MRKLSLRMVLEEVSRQSDLEDFSAGLEGDDGEYQTPDYTNPQDVWGGPNINDSDLTRAPRDASAIYSQYNLSPEEMSGWIDQIQSGGFTPELYQQISARVGDMDNFLLDIQEIMPQIHQFMMDKSGGAYSKQGNGGLRNELAPKLEPAPMNRGTGRPIPTVQSQVNKLKATKDDIGVEPSALKLANFIPDEKRRQQALHQLAANKQNRDRVAAQQRSLQTPAKVVSRNPDGITNPAKRIKK